MNSYYYPISSSDDSRDQASPRPVCDHVLQYKKNRSSEWRKLYEVLYGHFITLKYEGSAKEKAKLECAICKTKQLIHACMDCIHFACFGEKHIHDHAGGKSHLIAFDTTFGCIYCFKCKDYQYDSEFEKIARKLQIEARTNAHYRANIYEPTQELLEFIKQNRNFNLHNINSTHLGLRGIINLGNNTCFMGCVLQVLFHAPIFRNYLLSNKHTCLDNQCLLQKMSVAAQKFFSGNEEAYVPSDFYYEIYRKLKTFVGSDHQDVIHFLSDFLHALHCHDIRSPCNCFIGNIFESLAEYTFACSNCKNVKKQELAFQCIFYSFQKDNPNENNVHNDDETRKNPNNKEKYRTVSNEARKNIEDLQWTTTLPHVNCCKKELEIKGAKKKKIPIIISFVNNIREPNERGVRISMEYPKVIDIRKFDLLISAQPSNFTKPDVTEDPKFLYYLFAIVTYFGDGSTGHYVSYIKQHNNWFKCNNEDIKEVKSVESKDVENKDVENKDVEKKKETVLKETVYALFYHKQVLDYKE